MRRPSNPLQLAGAALAMTAAFAGAEAIGWEPKFRRPVLGERAVPDGWAGKRRPWRAWRRMYGMRVTGKQFRRQEKAARRTLREQRSGTEGDHNQ